MKTEPKLPEFTNLGVSNYKDYEIFDKCRGPICHLLQTFEDHDMSKQAAYRAIGTAFRKSENDRVQDCENFLMFQMTLRPYIKFAREALL